MSYKGCVFINQTYDRGETSANRRLRARIDLKDQFNPNQ